MIDKKCRRCGKIGKMWNECMECLDKQRALREHEWGYYGEDEEDGVVHKPREEGAASAAMRIRLAAQVGAPKIERWPYARRVLNGTQYVRGFDLVDVVDGILSA
jgi:hypothetical protein